MIGIVTIGQSPRSDLTPELLPHLPPCRVIEHGALDGLTDSQIAALAPRDGEEALTSRLASGGSAVFGHDQAMPLVQQAIDRAENDGVDAVLVVCAGSFPSLRHTRPLLLTEALAHHGAAAIAHGRRVGIVRPLPSQIEDGCTQWERSLGRPVAAAAAASPYTDGIEAVAQAAAQIADRCDLVVLDCIGYDEPMRRAAADASGRPVLLVRSLAARLAGELLEAGPGRA
jgi:protein AroM